MEQETKHKKPIASLNALGPERHEGPVRYHVII